MQLTVIHTGEKVTVKKSLVTKTYLSLNRYLYNVRSDRKQQVRGALYELYRGRTVSAEAAGINERVDPSLMTCTYYNQEGW